jgi:hypothetical protein
MVLVAALFPSPEIPISALYSAYNQWKSRRMEYVRRIATYYDIMRGWFIPIVICLEASTLMFL